MTLPVTSYSSALACFSPVMDMTRAMDVLNAVPLLQPDERLAASTLLDRFSAANFEEGSPEREAAKTLMSSLEPSRGADCDQMVLGNLQNLWTIAAPPGSGVFPLDRVRPSPRFHIGPVAVYQSDYLTSRWLPNEYPAVLHGEGGYLRLQSNEKNFPLFYPSIANAGGVVFGVGTFQNLNLAVASAASGLIMADLSPMVAMSMALLISQIPKQASRYDFAETALKLFRKGEDAAPFLEDVSEDYRPLVSFMIDQMRGPMHFREMKRYFTKALQDPSEALSRDTFYDYLAERIRAGGASVIHGNLFETDMPDLVASAMSVHADPLRMVYLSNAPEWIRREPDTTPLQSLSGLLRGPRTDPNGVLLTSTEFGRSEDARNQKARLADQFSYHALPLSDAATLLRAYGRVSRFVERLQAQPGLTYPPQTESTP